MATAEEALQLARLRGTMFSYGITSAANQAHAAVRAGRWDDALALLDAFPYHAPEGFNLVSFAAPRFDVFLQRGDLGAAARTLAPVIEQAAAAGDAQFGASTMIRAAQLALATGQPGDARAHIAAALAISVRCEDMIYAPKACSVGISAEAACPAPDHGTVEALTTRLSDIEVMARSFGGQLLADAGRVHGDGPREAGELGGGPQPGAWQAAAAAWDRCGDQYWAAVCKYRAADALLRARGDRTAAASIAVGALATARSLGAAPLAADLETLIRRGQAGSQPGPRPAPPPARPDRPRDRGTQPRRRRPHQPPDRRRPVHQRENRQRPRHQPLAKTRRRHPRRSRRDQAPTPVRHPCASSPRGTLVRTLLGAASPNLEPARRAAKSGSMLDLAQHAPVSPKFPQLRGLDLGLEAVSRLVAPGI